MSDPVQEIDELLQFITECEGELPDCFIDLKPAYGGFGWKKMPTYADYRGRVISTITGRLEVTADTCVHRMRCHHCKKEIPDRQPGRWLHLGG
jgi:hypothetical protein